jgi:putative addiction module component (TIGR02574 family)
MSSNIRNLPLDERIRLVEDLWDSIAQDQDALELTPGQAEELSRRLDAFESDNVLGQLAGEVISRIRSSL